MQFTFELTDTFGGEANYSWVKRHAHQTKNENPSDLSLVRAAKAWAGWQEIQCTIETWGETIAIHPAGMCLVLFVAPSDQV